MKVHLVGYNSDAGSTGLISIRLAVFAFQMYKIAQNSKKIRIYSSSRWQVIQSNPIGANWKLIGNFLLVINSNFGRISRRCRDIAAQSWKNFAYPNLVWR